MSDRPVLINSRGENVEVDELIEKCRSDPNRILADDEVGLVVYVGDLDVHTVTGLGHPETGASAPHANGRWVQKVTEISIVRYGESVRHQIGSVVKSLSADAVFIIREGASLRKVRAKDLKSGMLLQSGEKVHW